ncbi:vacuole effluxer Atg22 like-domain-containing protein [Obelidium mucronatum]|nr:vacuole effluxer Atg22 like-domain-containing protein [Obelidium mucronatum]
MSSSSSSTLDPAPSEFEMQPRQRLAGLDDCDDDCDATPSGKASMAPTVDTTASTARLVRRSVILQFQQLMALAADADKDTDKPAAPARWWQRRPPKKSGPAHKDIDSLFAGIKHPPLSREELNAFYAFSLGTEPMVVVIFTALSTVVLQNMAAGAGVEESDHSVRCNYTVQNYKCVTNIGGAWIDPSSFSLYTIATSVLLQAVFFISLGALADHSSFRKKFLVFFMLSSILLCCGMVTIRHSSLFLVASALQILAQLTFGASYCFYNSYIPVLSAVHWDVLSATDENRLHVHEATMNTISTISQVYGYCGAVGCFAVAGGLVFALQTLPVSSGFGIGGFFDSLGVTTYSMQVGIFATGVWALVGLYWPARYIRDRPYAPLPKGTNYITYSWKQVYKTVSHARQMPNTFIMLLAWFFLSDAMSTVGSTTILFATNELGFKSTEILILAIVAPLTAGGGNYLWLLIQRKFNYSTKHMLMMLVSLAIILPMYGMMGFFLPFGLKAKWELFPAGIFYGMLLGGIQSFARVLFSELIPRGHEGEFFALYAITDKGSAWIGPLIVGSITDVTHQIRYGFIFLFFLLMLPVVCLYFLNVEKGQIDAEAFHASELDAAMLVNLSPRSPTRTGINDQTLTEAV